jgi:hypothetical protein
MAQIETETSAVQAPSDITTNAQVFDLDFHPSRDVIAIGNIDGVVEL